jgi:hypothetical protein
MQEECSINGSPSLTDLANRFGSDKGTSPGDWGVSHGYATIYERFLSVRRFEPLRLLEIGVWKGGSLRMWESYLPNAQIIGIDNLSSVIQQRAKRAEILIGDAADQQFLNDVLERFAGGKVDIVIDDASHILDQQVRTFEILFPCLEEGGLYFVEDVSGSRFHDGNRGLLPYFDFLDYSWNLAQQTTFFPDDQTSTWHNINDLRSLSPAERDQIRVSFWNHNLHSVHYFHDLCVFEKRHRRLENEDLKPADRLHPNPGISYQLRSLGSRTQNHEIDNPEVDELRHKFEHIVELISDFSDTPEDNIGVSRKNVSGETQETVPGKPRALSARTREFSEYFHRFINEFKARKNLDATPRKACKHKRERASQDIERVSDPREYK